MHLARRRYSRKNAHNQSLIEGDTGPIYHHRSRGDAAHRSPCRCAPCEKIRAIGKQSFSVSKGPQFAAAARHVNDVANVLRQARDL